ncbi:hypothetical protein CCICO_03385 [Corynebacterium ciconiae DSM 44920]|nr:hypothetical protein CCICO_03385 [Corynebacterium ciconiae DSM 44920]
MRIGLDLDTATVSDLIELADTLRTLDVAGDEGLVIDDDTRELYVEYSGLAESPFAAGAQEEVIEPEEVDEPGPAETPGPTENPGPTGGNGEERIEFPRGTSFDAGKVYDAVRQTLGDQAVHSVLDALLRGRGGPTSR